MQTPPYRLISLPPALFHDDDDNEDDFYHDDSAATMKSSNKRAGFLFLAKSVSQNKPSKVSFFKCKNSGNTSRDVGRGP